MSSSLPLLLSVPLPFRNSCRMGCDSGRSPAVDTNFVKTSHVSFAYSRASAMFLAFSFARKPDFVAASKAW